MIGLKLTQYFLSQEYINVEWINLKHYILESLIVNDVIYPGLDSCLTPMHEQDVSDKLIEEGVLGLGISEFYQVGFLEVFD